MKTKSRTLVNVLASSFFLGFGVDVLVAQSATGDKTPTMRGDRTRGVETRQDLPGDFHPYYGQKLNRYRDLDRRIAKIDLDADLNMDGVIRQGDVRDSGAFEQTPPGLIVGVKEMSKVLIDVIPYRVDFQGFCVVALEISGLNRGSQSGQFNSLEEEQASVGRVKVWRDIERKTLLLDSGDPTKRVVEFSVSAMKYPANLPNAIPRTVYIEGVKPSGQYLGDLRLLAVVSHRYKEDARQDLDELIQSGKETTTAKEPVKVEKAPSPILKRFRTSFDHILITVENQPVPKAFVNANAEKVWVDVR